MKPFLCEEFVKQPALQLLQWPAGANGSLRAKDSTPWRGQQA